MHQTLITADLHWSADPREQYRHNFVTKQLVPLIKAKRASKLVLIGDLTDQKDRHPSELVNAVVGHLHDLSQHCDVIINRGNHDYVTPDSPFFQFVGKMDGVTWVNEPTWIDLGFDEALFLPHTRTPEEDWEAIGLRGLDARLVFAHGAFTGAKSESGKVLEGTSTDLFPPGASVVAGDIHVPQRVGPVTYVGAPYRMRYGDSYTPRVLLMNGPKLTSINVGGPQKHLLEVIHPLPGNWRPPDDLYEGDIVKIRVHLLKADYANWKDIKSNWTQWADEMRVGLYNVQPIVEAEKSSAGLGYVVKAKPDREVLGDYGRARGIDADTMTVGEEIANEV